MYGYKFEADKFLRNQVQFIMSHTDINVYIVRTLEGDRAVVSLLSHDEVFANGLASAAIVGEFLCPIPSNAPIPVEHFVRNRFFVEILHQTIANKSPRAQSFLAEALKQNNGWVYVVDQRTQQPDGEIPLEDIIGVFEVKDGILIDGSYEANKNHRILSTAGFFDVGPELYPYLIDAVRERIGAEK